jgi:hypothetical protein
MSPSPPDKEKGPFRRFSLSRRQGGVHETSRVRLIGRIADQESEAALDA